MADAHQWWTRPPLEVHGSEIVQPQIALPLRGVRDEFRHTEPACGAEHVGGMAVRPRRDIKNEMAVLLGGPGEYLD